TYLSNDNSLYTTLFFLLLPPSPDSTLFPYTTLFRSKLTSYPLSFNLFSGKGTYPSSPGTEGNIRSIQSCFALSMVSRSVATKFQKINRSSGNGSPPKIYTVVLALISKVQRCASLVISICFGP